MPTSLPPSHLSQKKKSLSSADKASPRTPTERLQKILARAGIASRRQSEELIRAGQVTINGKVAQLGDQAIWGKDAIKVQNKLLFRQDPPLYLAFYKPKNVISAFSDPQGRPTLEPFFEKIKTRLFPLGNLDFNNEGLILLTNEGSLVTQFQNHDQIPRLYTVKVKGHPDEEMMSRLSSKIHPSASRKALSPSPFSPPPIRILQKLQQKSILQYVLFQDRSSEIQPFFERRGFLIDKIVRQAIGHIELKGLQPGKYRTLQHSQVLALIEQPELGLRGLVEPEKERKKTRFSGISQLQGKKRRGVAQPG